MLPFFYSPAAAARNRRGRDREHHHARHGRASSASTPGGRRAKESAKGSDARSPTPKSPQSVSIQPVPASDRPRSQLVAPCDFEQLPSTGTSAAAAEIGSAPVRAEEPEKSAADTIGQEPPATLSLSQQFRTPASLQPYLEDDNSESGEDVGPPPSTSNPAVIPSDLASASAPTGPAAPSKESSELGASGRIDSFRQSPTAPNDGKSVDNTLPSPTEDGDAGRGPPLDQKLAKRRLSLQGPQSQRKDHTEAESNAGGQQGTQERRRSMLSQSFVHSEDSDRVEPASLASRTFTPPVVPVGALPLNSPPQFMSPIPIRASYPLNEPFGGQVAPPAAFATGFYPRRSLNVYTEQYAGHPAYHHVPHYMDQMIQGEPPMAYQPITSSFHSLEQPIMEEAQTDVAQLPFHSVPALLGRVEKALPDIHQLVQQLKDMSNHMHLQLAEFRQADYEKNELLRDRDHHIHQLSGELEQHDLERAHERATLEQQLFSLEIEYKRLRDEALQAQQTGKHLLLERKGTRSRSNTLPTKEAIPPHTAKEGQALQQIKHESPQTGCEDDNIASTQQRSKVGEVAGSPVQDGNEIRSRVEDEMKQFAMAPETRLAGGRYLDAELDTFSSTIAREVYIPETRTKLMPGAFEQVETEAIEEQEPLGNETSHHDPSGPGSLEEENILLRDELQRLRLGWESDKSQLIETNHKLECAAIKLGIENVSPQLAFP